ncbi:MAG: ABC transporter ATP-binding protein [Bacteroidales bacterium]|nr:ABC transporter ATP-binding protein [Bacteroidales bacterium]MCF8389607.1 ABC transporter ATP-binding protein [Bacteroidales bacterium]
MSIKVESLTKTFGSQKAVNNISFEIQKGEIVGFIGPNGAGKSTTMKILTGFLPPDSGQAFIAGLNVRDHNLKIKRILGYLPENNPLYPEMYVREYLDYVLKMYVGSRVGKEIVSGYLSVNKVIELTGLAREQHKKIGALSKGYRQRVGLAQAIIHNPEVLILDEPTSGLDPGQIIEIRNLILSLGKDKTILLSTHLMQEVKAICTRVIMINRGEILADGSAEEISLARETTNTVVIELDKISNSEKINEIEGVIQYKKIGENKLLIESKADTDIRPLLFNFAVENKLTILSLQKKEKSLEEVFGELLAK